MENCDGNLVDPRQGVSVKKMAMALSEKHCLCQHRLEKKSLRHVGEMTFFYRPLLSVEIGSAVDLRYEWKIATETL